MGKKRVPVIDDEHIVVDSMKKYMSKGDKYVLGRSFQIKGVGWNSLCALNF